MLTGADIAYLLHGDPQHHQRYPHHYRHQARALTLPKPDPLLETAAVSAPASSWRGEELERDAVWIPEAEP